MIARLLLGKAGLRVALSSRAVSGSLNCSFAVNADGFVYANSISVERWLLAGLAGSVEVFASGVGSTTTGSPLNTWLPLSSTASWGLLTTGPDKTCTLTVSLRKIGATSPLVTATVTMDVGTA